jgi:hypothetical protein
VTVDFIINFKVKKMKLIIPVLMLLNYWVAGYCQNVGIGTQTPAGSALLDISGTAGGLLLPRLTTTQMNKIPNPTQGLTIYNTTLNRPFAYFGNTTALPPRWRSMVGPEVLAWGFVDSCNTPCGNDQFDINPIRIINGSGNFNVIWRGGDKRWYELIPSQSSTFNHQFQFGDKRGFSIDSMMLIITPVGNGTWDIIPSVGSTEISPNDVRATIKFTDVSRLTGGNFSNTMSRRKSYFYFVLYRIN